MEGVDEAVVPEDVRLDDLAPVPSEHRTALERGAPGSGFVYLC